MKRCIATLLGLGVAGLVLAQAPFTIVRPADGSKVREKIHFLIPKNSVPDSGYVGVFLTYPDSSGTPKRKFLEAMVPQQPDKKSKYLEYVLDSKDREIPDGKLNVELVLYVDYKDQPRIVDRSSVDVTVANSTSIKVPDDGFLLRYKFRPGIQYVYDVEIRNSTANLTEAQKKMGDSANDLPFEAQTGRMCYSIDNVYPGGDALVRIQPLPTKGKDYAYLIATGDAEPRKYMDFEMAPLYARLSNTGMERFGSCPLFWPIDSVSGEGDVSDLIGTFPLPTLPDKPRKPGDYWQGRIMSGSDILDNRFEAGKVFSSGVARGEFVRVEWENGFPCAVIRNTLDQGLSASQSKDLTAAGIAGATESKKTDEELIWFALDQGIVVKVMRTITKEGKVVVTTGGGGPSGPGMPGMPGGRMGSKNGPPPGISGPAMGGGGMTPPGSKLLQKGGGRGNYGGSRNGPPSMGMPGLGGPGTGAGSGSRSSGSSAVHYYRITYQEIMTLEQ